MPSPPVELARAGVAYPNGVRGLVDVDLTVAPGEILGVIGEKIGRAHV